MTVLTHLQMYQAYRGFVCSRVWCGLLSVRCSS